MDTYNTCTYESINNFKLSAFLLQIVYIHCMWGEIVCALPVIGLNPICCRGSVAINSTYIHTHMYRYYCHELTMNREKSNILIGSELAVHTAGIAR